VVTYGPRNFLSNTCYYRPDDQSSIPSSSTDLLFSTKQALDPSRTSICWAPKEFYQELKSAGAWRQRLASISCQTFTLIRPWHSTWTRCKFVFFCCVYSNIEEMYTNHPGNKKDFSANNNSFKIWKMLITSFIILYKGVVNVISPSTSRLSKWSSYFFLVFYMHLQADILLFCYHNSTYINVICYVYLEQFFPVYRPTINVTSSVF
jgi:hypothetical protein